MTRKPLPKAILRTSDALRNITAGIVTDEEAPAPRPALPRDEFEAEPAAADFSRPAANDQFLDTAAYPSGLAAQRRALAQKIVARHKNYATLGGLVPLPVANIASVAAINLRMVKQLSELYQVPFHRDRTRALIVGLIGGAVPTGLGTATSSTLMWVVPGGMLLSLGVSAVTAGALTRGIGLVFVEHFESTAA